MPQLTVTTEDVVTDFLQRTSGDDADGIAALFAEHVDWYVGGDPSLPWTGTRSTRGDIAHYFRLLWRHLARSRSTTTLEKIIVSGPDAVVLATLAHTAAGTGRAFRTPAAMHLTVDHGKIVRMHLYEDTLAVSRAFTD